MLLATALLVTDGRFPLWSALGIAAGVYWCCKGLRAWYRKRVILNAPASKIRNASMGLVEISGLAVSPYIMISPLRRAGCYFYRSVVWEWKQGGSKPEWAQVAEESLHFPFYLDDDTEKVLIDPRGAEIEVQCDFRQQYEASGEGPPMPHNVSEFLLRHHIDPKAKVKVEEYCIKPKDFLFVLGTMSQNPGIDATVMPAWAERADRPALRMERKTLETEIIRLSASTTLVPTSEMTQQQKIAAALMRAGINNPVEWNGSGMQSKTPTRQRNCKEVTSAAIALSAEDESTIVDPKGFDLHPPVVLMKGNHEPAFFISWRSQRDVAKARGWKSTIMICAGSALILGCVYRLLAAFIWH